jgi:hypothetical protein
MMVVIAEQREGSEDNLFEVNVGCNLKQTKGGRTVQPLKNPVKFDQHKA